MASAARLHQFSAVRIPVPHINGSSCGLSRRLLRIQQRGSGASESLLGHHFRETHSGPPGSDCRFPGAEDSGAGTSPPPQPELMRGAHDQRSASTHSGSWVSSPSTTLAFFAMLRPGEVLMGDQPKHTIRLRHVVLRRDRLSLNLPSSKTSNTPFHTELVAWPDLPYCPVRAV